MFKTQKPSTDEWPRLQPCTREPYKLLMQGLASIVRVAQGQNAKMALEAGEWLVAYGERLLMEKAAAKAHPVVAMNESRDKIIEELRGLYAKALGEAPLIVEAEPEGAATPEAVKLPRD